MTPKRLFLFSLLAIGFCGQAVEAQTPIFQDFASKPAVPMLRAQPLMLSQYPTTISIALSKDQSHLRSIDVEGRIWKWPIRPPANRILIAETNSEPACATISDDGSLLAFADPDGSVAVMDLDTKQIKFRDTAKTDRTVTLRFSPSSNELAAVTTAGIVRVFNVSGGHVSIELLADKGPVQMVAFSPDGHQIAVASNRRHYRLYELKNNGVWLRVDNEVLSGMINNSRVTACAYSPDGKWLVIATTDGTAVVKDLTGDREPRQLATYPFAIWSITFDESGSRMAAGSWDGTIRIWDTESWGLLQSLKKHEESVTTMILAEQGMISAGLDGRLVYWPPATSSEKLAGMISGRSDPVWVAAYSPDGKKMFVGGNNKRFELWDLDEKKLRLWREWHPTTRCAAFSPDGKTLATGGDDGKILLLNSENGTTRKQLLGHPGLVSAVVFTDDGKSLISGCDRGHVKIWDTATGEEKFSWRKHKQQLYCASLSPDQKWLVTGGGNWTNDNPGELIVWELKTGQVRARLDGHKLAVWSIVFTPDGKLFASSDSSGAVKIWNWETLEEERTLQHEIWVRPLAMSPDGKTLAVGRGDGSVRLWDTTTWQQIGSYDGHNSFTFWLQYAADGKTLVSGGNDGTVRFWNP